ncbi:MAG: EF-P beta-lysylation protein EpmB [Gammaproteobacteria bacterium]|nr:MAG: EF-P beta-lysylation protein EpmB [Gammaproteobacteria bacterium]
MKKQQILPFLNNKWQKIYSSDADNYFHCKIPDIFIEKINFKNDDDVLLKQFLPNKKEMQLHHKYHLDPLREQTAIKNYFVHTYKSRLLVFLNNNCVVNCRYCFRKHIKDKQKTISKNFLENIKDHIINCPQINEIILSGGDPLTLSNNELFKHIDCLLELEQIKTIRIHSKMLSANPLRIDDEFLSYFAKIKIKKVLVSHINHNIEIGKDTKNKTAKLKQRDFTVLNQSVLLKGVNDDIKILTELCEDLWQAGILPYYLHILDKTVGTMHFYVPKKQAIALHNQLKNNVSGFITPKLVQQKENHQAKLWLS